MCREHRISHRIIILTTFLAAAATALAPAFEARDDDDVVEVRNFISRDAVRPGETFKAAVILKVQAGYHINDNAPIDEFMIPTNLAIGDDQGFEVVEIYYPNGRRARFAYSETELVVYEGEVALGALLKAKEGLALGVRTLKASLSYQACDNVSCLPPKELAFEITVPVSASGGTTDLRPEIFGKLPFKSLRK